jgi:hypothetical protein
MNVARHGLRQRLYAPADHRRTASDEIFAASRIAAPIEFGDDRIQGILAEDVLPAPAI